MTTIKHISTRHQRLLINFFLIMLIVTVYVQVGTFDFVDFDDSLYVTENSHVRDGLTLDGFIWAFTTTHEAIQSQSINLAFSHVGCRGVWIKSGWTPLHKHIISCCKYLNFILCFISDDRSALAKCFCGRAFCHSSASRGIRCMGVREERRFKHLFWAVDGWRILLLYQDPLFQTFPVGFCFPQYGPDVQAYAGDISICAAFA